MTEPLQTGDVTMFIWLIKLFVYLAYPLMVYGMLTVGVLPSETRKYRDHLLADLDKLAYDIYERPRVTALDNQSADDIDARVRQMLQ